MSPADQTVRAKAYRYKAHLGLTAKGPHKLGQRVPEGCGNTWDEKGDERQLTEASEPGLL